jgi:Tfp pilus assembly protein PilF
LKVWKAFFTRAHIIGVDINPTCARFADDRVSIEIGSQDDPGFLLELAAKYPPSIIIDDGSHRTDHVIYTFERLFPSLLPGGIYIVEDLDLHIREPKKWQGPGGGSPSDYFLNVARSCLARSVQGAADWGTVHYTLDHVDDVEFVRGATIVHKIATKQNITSALDFADVYLDGRASEAAVHERLSQFILRHDGPPERAETELRRAIELGGETPGVLRNYAHIRLREQRLPEAAVLAERCATVAEDDPHAWDFAGSVHTRNGDHAAAARAFGRAVALRPGNPGFALALSQSLQRIGRLKEALSAARQGLEVATGTAQEEVLRKRVERLLTKVGD